MRDLELMVGREKRRLEKRGNASIDVGLDCFLKL